MDRSFLSQPEVIAASRRFVCIRLTTYENKAEAEMLKRMTRTGSGELENTVFTVLSPGGEKYLVRSSRSARQTFGTAEHMAQEMNRIAESYEVRSETRTPDLPRTPGIRLALNVAACDNLPLVVMYSKDEMERAEMEARMKPLAWSSALIGRCAYATCDDPADLKPVTGVKPEPGVLVIQPDTFGTKGKLLGSKAPATPEKELTPWLKTTLASARFEPKQFNTHVRNGHRLGVFWETAIPVTDPMELRARERGRRP